MAKESHDLIPGTVFISDKTQITVIEIKDGSVEVLVIKPGKTGKIKEWDNDKFLEKTKDLKIVPTDPKFRLNQTGSNTADIRKNSKNQNLEFVGVFIKSEDILLRAHPLKKNDQGVTELFIFAINGQDQKILVGESKNDPKPIWIDVQIALMQLDEKHLQSLSIAEIKSDSLKDLREKATDIFKKLS